jgi:hypothetical protein
MVTCLVELLFDPVRAIPGLHRVERRTVRRSLPTLSELIATRGSERLRVRERIYTAAGDSWTDVSSWYWQAVLERTTGPWWAITVAERDDQSAP